MKRFFGWIIVNALYASIFVASVILQSNGLAVLGASLTVVLLIISALMFVMLMTRDTLEEFVDDDKFKDNMNTIIRNNGNRPLWLKILDPLYDVVLLVFLAYNDFYVTTILYTFVIVVQYFALSLCAQMFEEQKNA